MIFFMWLFIGDLLHCQFSDISLGLNTDHKIYDDHELDLYRVKPLLVPHYNQKIDDLKIDSENVLKTGSPN